MPPAPPLTHDARLTRAASLHSADMAKMRTMSHQGSDGSNPGQRIQRQGYGWWTWGENVAAGQSSVAAVMGSWLNSEGHCRNIMNPRFTQFGAGEVDRYWTQVFASPR